MNQQTDTRTHLPLPFHTVVHDSIPCIVNNLIRRHLTQYTLENMVFRLNQPSHWGRTPENTLQQLGSSARENVENIITIQYYRLPMDCGQVCLSNLAVLEEGTFTFVWHITEVVCCVLGELPGLPLSILAHGWARLQSAHLYFTSTWSQLPILITSTDFSSSSLPPRTCFLKSQTIGTISHCFKSKSNRINYDFQYKYSISTSFVQIRLVHILLILGVFTNCPLWCLG